MALLDWIIVNCAGNHPFGARMTHTSFVRTHRKFLKAIAAGNPRTPSLYYHSNFCLREVFWLRLWAINRQMGVLKLNGGRCLDFGGGGGVFLPTLSARFDDVTCLDLETRDANRIVGYHELSNVTVKQGNVEFTKFDDMRFDVIVAADVLEHFKDLSSPVKILQKWLAPNGFLFTSLPTENWVYVLLRMLFKIRKPEDHYHTASEVEAYLMRSGFRPLYRSYLPLGIPFASLFRITAWQLHSR